MTQNFFMELEIPKRLQNMMLQKNYLKI